jgi:hypothetical protein
MFGKRQVMFTLRWKQYNDASEQSRRASDDGDRGPLGRHSGHCLFGADAADDASRA